MYRNFFLLLKSDMWIEKYSEAYVCMSEEKVFGGFFFFVEDNFFFYFQTSIVSYRTSYNHILVPTAGITLFHSEIRRALYYKIDNFKPMREYYLHTNLIYIMCVQMWEVDRI